MIIKWFLIFWCLLLSIKMSSSITKISLPYIACTSVLGNITRVRLTPPDYDKWLPPKNLRQIEISLIIKHFHIYDVFKRGNIASQISANLITFSASIKLNTSWSEERVADYISGASCDLSINIPRIFVLLNQEYSEVLWEPIVSSKSFYHSSIITSVFPSNYLVVDIFTGHINRIINSEVLFSCTLDPFQFPFELIECVFEIEVRFPLHYESLDISEKLVWRGVSFENSLELNNNFKQSEGRHEIKCEQKVCLIKEYANLKRNPSFLIFSQYMTSFIAVIVSMSTFYLPFEAWPIIRPFLCLSTLAILLWNLNGMNRMTYNDRLGFRQGASKYEIWFYFCIAMSFLTWIEYQILIYLWNQKVKQFRLVYNAIFEIKLKEKMKVDDLTTQRINVISDQEMDKMIRFVPIIDYVSRIIFGITFVLFTSIYLIKMELF